MGSPNFVPLSDDLWGIKPQMPQQMQQMPMQIPAGAMPPGYGGGGPPMPQMMPANAPAPPPQSAAQQNAAIIREIVQMKQVVQHLMQSTASGTTTDKYLMWIVIILGVIALIFLVKFVVWFKRGKTMSFSPAYSPSPVGSPY